MNKFKIIALSVTLLGVVACDKITGKGNSEAHGKFVEMCLEDPRAKTQGFDCTCQADIIQAVLKEEEMTNLVNFLNVEKADRNKAIEMGKDPQYAPMFQKIGGIGLAIHDKCGNKQAEAAAAAQPAPAGEAPATEAPVEAPAAETPAEAPAAQ